MPLFKKCQEPIVSAAEGKSTLDSNFIHSQAPRRIKSMPTRENVIRPSKARCCRSDPSREQIENEVMPFKKCQEPIVSAAEGKSTLNSNFIHSQALRKINFSKFNLFTYILKFCKSEFSFIQLQFRDKLLK
ncbi:hypothetical protein AVEN_195060-1 [Araneus ventricosus]|nr:hypothetical protein AVEN_46463-1 [Araneus ventricosus]GBN87523.1 hypothetical protein AVEN_195060-1 [Araneus ventricosus]